MPSSEAGDAPMRLVTTLILVPLALAITAALLIPGGIGLMAGMVCACAYLVVLAARASDWT